MSKSKRDTFDIAFTRAFESIKVMTNEQLQLEIERLADIAFNCRVRLAALKAWKHFNNKKED